MNIRQLCSLVDSYQPQRKEIAPLLAAALPAMITGGAAIISSGIGAASQSSANKANLAEAEKAREWQSNEHELNRSWQTEMWNKQNAYNSPLNQMGLYRQGGLNPLLVNGSTPTSGAGAAGTPAMVGASNVGHVNPVNPLAGAPDAFSSIYQAMQQGMQVQSNQKLQSAQAIKTLVDAVTESYDKFGSKGYKEIMSSVAPILKNISLEGSRSDVLFSEQLKNNLSMRYNQDMDSLNKEIQYNLGKKYGEQQIQANLEKLDYEISEIVGRLGTMNVQNEALVKKTAAELMVAAAQAFQLRKVGDKYEADTNTANELRRWVVKTAQHIAEMKEVDSYFSTARKESSIDLVGYWTSKEGRETLTKGVRRDMREKADVLIRTFDKLFGEYVKVSSSGSAGSYGFNQSYYGTESSNTSYGW